MNAYVKNKLKRFRRLNDKGGIEGLPMELMIIVVVATIGCGIMIGWMGNIEEPETIGDIQSSVGQVTMYADNMSNFEFSVTVTDSHGDPIKNASVSLSGCNIHQGAAGTPVCTMTDSSGVASFSGLSLTKTGSGVGYITVTVSAGDYGEDSIKIPVVR